MTGIYLDHAATTPPFPEVVAAMSECLLHNFGNPSSLHRWGRDAHRLLDQAREQVASLIGAAENDLIFTSGGTEADNLAILGVVRRNPAACHLITSAIEHDAVLECCRAMERRGLAQVTYLPVNRAGQVSVADVAAAIRPETRLVSIMLANNEIGSIQPLAEIGALLQKHENILFHIDAVQAVGKIAVDVTELACDLLSYSAHKINGPKGCGALYLRSGVHLERNIYGGGQERKLRSGTENLPAIVGFGVAAAQTQRTWQTAAAQAALLTNLLRQRLTDLIPNIYFNSDANCCLPNILHCSLPYADGERLLLLLDNDGIAVSNGSACSAGSLQPSHVLHALNAEAWRLSCPVRFSVGLGNTAEQIEFTARQVAERVNN